MQAYFSDSSFIPVIEEIRQRINECNVQLPINQIPEESDIKPKPTTRYNEFSLIDDKIFDIGQASPSEFSFHWETMTVKQKRKGLYDFVECEYKTLSNTQKDKIKEFLCKDLVRCNIVNSRVQWNGYFVDAVCGLRIKPVRDNGANKNNNMKTDKTKDLLSDDLSVDKPSGLSDDKPNDLISNILDSKIAEDDNVLDDTDILNSEYMLEDNEPEKLPAQLAYENVQVDKRQVEMITEEDEIIIGFEKKVSEKAQTRQKGDTGPTSFNVLRTRVKRERDTFFVDEAKEI
jgi:hypothetical protein